MTKVTTQHQTTWRWTKI